MSDIKFDGNKLYESRRSKKLTQAKLANLIGVSRQSIYLWETNQSCPDIEKVSKLCDVLEIDINELIDGFDVKEENKSNIETISDDISENIDIEVNTDLDTNVDITNNTDITTINKFEFKHKFKFPRISFKKFITYLIIFIIFIHIVFSTIRYIRLEKILDKWKEFDKTDSYYIRIFEYLVKSDDKDIMSESLFYEKYYNNGVLKTIIKNRKDNEIQNIIICDYNKGQKYIIYEDTKTYRIELIDKNKENVRLSSNFTRIENNNNFKKYIDCLTFKIDVIKNDYYEIIFKDAIKQMVNKDTFLLEQEENINDQYRNIRCYYEIELNTKKDFEINLDEYTEIE